MEIAIGLPDAVPGTTGGQPVEWVRRALLGKQTLSGCDEPIFSPTVSNPAQADLFADAPGL